MLDPWTALSLAASITQFVDFGAKLISSAKTIREHGSSLDLISIKKTTEDLQDILEIIQNQRGSHVKWGQKQHEEKVGSHPPEVVNLIIKFAGFERSCRRVPL